MAEGSKQNPNDNPSSSSSSSYYYKYRSSNKENDSSLITLQRSALSLFIINPAAFLFFFVKD